jgi:hypothetical protein
MEKFKNMYGELNMDWGDMTDEEIDEFIEKLNKALWSKAYEF